MDSYDLLIEKIQKKQITNVDFVISQESLKQEYYDYLKENNYSIDEESACNFLREMEDEIMLSQKTIL